MHEDLPLSSTHEAILECISDGVYVVDRARRICYWNGSAERLSGYAPGDVMGRSCQDSILMHVDEHGTLLCRAGCPLAATMRDGKRREARVYMHHRDGSRRPVWVRSAPLRDDEGRIVGAVEVFNADTAGEEARAQLREATELAESDPLTGISNRRYLDTRLAARLGDLERYGWPFGVVFVDVDDFKAINDGHGHEVGDDVLAMVATTISHATRLTDVVARHGGDEFVVLLAGVGRDELEAGSDRIRSLVNASYLQRNGRRVHVSVSVGAALAHPGDDAESLLRRADERMYRAKQAGGNHTIVRAS